MIIKGKLNKFNNYILLNNQLNKEKEELEELKMDIAIDYLLKNNFNLFRNQNYQKYKDAI